MEIKSLFALIPALKSPHPPDFKYAIDRGRKATLPLKIPGNCLTSPRIRSCNTAARSF
jgi:hypothetical protein